MSAENSNPDAATPAHLDIARTARALIAQRDQWQKDWIKREPWPLPDLPPKDKEELEKFQKEQFHLHEIAEERANATIQKLPEHERPAATEEVQKILNESHDKWNKGENDVPPWSQHVNSPLAQELLREADMRAWQINTPEALQRHKEAIERNLRSTEPPKERDRERD